MILPPQPRRPPVSSSPTTAIPGVPIFSFTNPPASQVPLSWSPIWTRRFIPSCDRRRPKNVAQSKTRQVNFCLIVSFATCRAAETVRCERTLASGSAGNPWMVMDCMGSFRQRRPSEHASPLMPFSKASGSYPSARHAHARTRWSHRLFHLFLEPR